MDVAKATSEKTSGGTRDGRAHAKRQKSLRHLATERAAADHQQARRQFGQVERSIVDQVAGLGNAGIDGVSDRGPVALTAFLKCKVTPSTVNTSGPVSRAAPKKRRRLQPSGGWRRRELTDKADAETITGHLMFASARTALEALQRRVAFVGGHAGATVGHFDQEHTFASEQTRA